jgi:hypothetical protein
VAESVKEYLARIGRKGGRASRRRLTVEQRSEAARKAAEARWAKQRKLVDEITKGTKQLLKASRAADARAKRSRQKQANP